MDFTQAFMGLQIPPGWYIAHDDYGSLLLATADGIETKLSGIQVYRLIQDYWQKEKIANEQHRATSAPPRNSAAAQRPAGNSGGTPAGGGTVSVTSVYPGAVAPFAPRPSLSAGQLTLLWQAATQAIAAQTAESRWPPPSRDLPREAPKAGELIGHRAWTLKAKNLLGSYSANVVWFPGQPMDDRTGSENVGIDDHNTAGVWAFKNPYALGREFWNAAQAHVFGTVWMWGTIIEHEHGYRAQYAAIRSLDYAGDDVNLDLLRRTYSV